MKIVFCAYREWALKIFEGIKHLPHEFLLIKNKDDFIFENCYNFKPDLILLFGWSWIVKKEFLDLAPCICLHPSRLPEFRGGSPIQNQIIRGVKDSAITLFYMDKGIDTGPIIMQENLSLKGHLSDVFERMTYLGIKMTKEILAGKINATPQDDSKSTFFKRRKPEQSELTLDNLKNRTAEELFDFMRALEDPYPNAFIRTKDGKKLLIKKVELN